MQTIGEKIFNLRREKGISQEELGFALNVSRQTVSRWERDFVKPAVENLEGLTQFFGVNSDYFLSKEVVTAADDACGQPADKEEVKKVHKFQNLKIMAVVAASTLLMLCAVACGVAAYVAVAPVQGQEVVTVNRFNGIGIACISVGLFSLVLLAAVLILCLKNRAKK